MNGTDNELDDEELDDEDDGPLPVDEFVALPPLHRKKVAYKRWMEGTGLREDDGT